MDKKEMFDNLCEQVEKCHKCQDMDEKTPVLSSKNGDLNAKIMFIAEAPGRLGADKTGIPLYGDVTGKKVQELLGIAADKETGWKGTGIFVTNAVLCNPVKLSSKTQNKINAAPQMHQELCKPYLLRTIEIVNPSLIVCLGQKAAAAFGINAKPMKSVIGKEFSYQGKKVYVLFHPSPKNNIWRPKVQQQQDWQLIHKLLS